MCVQDVITNEAVQYQGNEDGVCLCSILDSSVLTCFIQHIPVGFVCLCYTFTVCKMCTFRM